MTIPTPIFTPEASTVPANVADPLSKISTLPMSTSSITAVLPAMPTMTTSVEYIGVTYTADTACGLSADVEC